MTLFLLCGLEVWGRVSTGPVKGEQVVLRCHLE